MLFSAPFYQNSTYPKSLISSLYSYIVNINEFIHKVSVLMTLMGNVFLFSE